MACCYDGARWESASFADNETRLLEGLAHLDERELAAGMRTLTDCAGPLRTCLARWDNIGRAALVLGRLIRIAYQAWPGESCEHLLGRLMPALRWDYGMRPVGEGLDSIGECATRRLLGADPTCLAHAVEVLWLAGVLELARCRERVDAIASIVQDAEGRCAAGGSWYGDAVAVAHDGFRALSDDRLGKGRVPERWLSNKLWLNALVMAHRQAVGVFGEESRDPRVPVVFRKLLRHVMAGGAWPIPCLENEALKGRVAECAASWESDKVLEGDTPLGPLSVEFLTNPLELLNIGNDLSTCHGLGEDSEHDGSLLGWATNANVRIVAARAPDRRIILRHKIGLVAEPDAGIVRGSWYPKEMRPRIDIIEVFVTGFLKDTGLRQLCRGAPVDTCVRAYRGGFPE